MFHPSTNIPKGWCFSDLSRSCKLCSTVSVILILAEFMVKHLLIVLWSVAASQIQFYETKTKRDPRGARGCFFNGIILIRLIWRNCLKLIFAFMFQSLAKVFSAVIITRIQSSKVLLERPSGENKALVKCPSEIPTLQKYRLIKSSINATFHQSSNVSIQVALAVFWPRPSWYLLQKWSGDGTVFRTAP